MTVLIAFVVVVALIWLLAGAIAAKRAVDSAWRAFKEQVINARP